MGNGKRRGGIDHTWTSPFAARQNELITAVAKVKPTIVVLHSGAPLDVSPWIDSVHGVVQSWFPGQEMGNVLLDVMNGNVNPCGKLPFSFLKRLEDNPSFGNFPATRDLVVEYSEGVYVGYRHYLTKGIETQFAFGSGLSYISFELSNLQISLSDEFPLVSVDVRNTGNVTDRGLLGLTTALSGLSPKRHNV
jgi:beta-glucosidase